MALNTKTSIVDYLKSQGQDASFGARTQLAQQHGITNYTGTAQQNTQLLSTLQGGSTPSPSPVKSTVKANQIQPPPQIDLPTTNAESQFVIGLTSQVDNFRKELENTLSSQKAQVDAKLEGLRQKETETLDKVGELTTPFREELENTERERLFVNQNFQENQKLVNELDQLLTEGNDLIRQQQEVTGLAAVRNPRIQKAMDDVAARAGVIEAVINARNGQIAMAFNMIDRSINAIASDRQDQISYYETILQLNRQDILMLDDESKQIATEQLNLKKGDLERAQATADYVKELLMDPATAGLMGEAGVKLNDSIETINAKLSEAQYSREVRDMANEVTLQGGSLVTNPFSVPADQLRSFTDSQGKTHYYKVPKEVDTVSEGVSAVDWLNNRDSKNTGIGSSQTSTSQSPNFSPVGGVGSVWVDPSTGIVWQFTSSGWRQIG